MKNALSTGLIALVSLFKFIDARYCVNGGYCPSGTDTIEFYFPKKWYFLKIIIIIYQIYKATMVQSINGVNWNETHIRN